MGECDGLRGAKRRSRERRRYAPGNSEGSDMATRVYHLLLVRRSLWLIALALAGAVILGMAIQRHAPAFGEAGASGASGDAPVRITAVKLASGSVEVGIETQQRDGSWAETVRPTARFLPADAPVGKKLHSSIVGVPAYYPLPESIEVFRTGTEGFYHEGESPLYCVVNHGIADDAFWLTANYRTAQSGIWERNNIRIVSNPDGSAQAAAIRQCVADGAFAIAATLAAPDAVGDALREATGAGVHVVTYNSGAEASRGVGAFAHIGLDDRRGGEQAGEWLNEQEISGQVQCLLHERDNVGLTQRCDGLESTYTGGGVQRVDVSEGIDELSSGLAGSEAAALVALNVDMTAAAAAALAHAERGDITLIGFGAGPAVLPPLFSGRLQMIVWDQPDLQGHLVAHLLSLPDRLFTGLPALELGSPFIAIEPVVYDLDTINTLLAALTPEARQAIMERVAGE